LQQDGPPLPLRRAVQDSAGWLIPSERRCARPRALFHVGVVAALAIEPFPNLDASFVERHVRIGPHQLFEDMLARVAFSPPARDDFFVDVFDEITTQLSMDGKGCWRDNVFVERFWRSIKYEEVYLHAYETVADARSGIAGHIDFYNRERPHSSLDKQTPSSFHGKHFQRSPAGGFRAIRDPLPNERRGRVSRYGPAQREHQ
jgi:Integrase core domain